MKGPMKRRDVITLLGAAAAFPPAASAQTPGKLRTIGYVSPATPESHGPWIAAFVRRLGELGWIENRTVAIEVRYANSRDERMVEIAAEFVRRKVDVIATSGQAIPAAKQATSTIPIVFALSGDPVASGFVESLARPGGNITGLSLQSPDLVGKRLELLREVRPGLRGLAIMANASYPDAVQEMHEVQTTAEALGLDVVTLELRRPEDIAPAFESLKGRADALYVCIDGLVNTNRIRINSLALSARLPTMFGIAQFVQAGGLMSYGANTPDLFRRAADYVDKILRGAKPADLPVEQPTKFEMVINLTPARALGLKISEAFLLRADEVIE